MPRMTAGLAMSALALAILGLVLFWIVPLGMVLSLAAFLVGLLGLTMRAAASPSARTLSLALALSVLGLAIQVWTSWDMIWQGR